MGFLSAVTDGFYRYTRDGRRVCGLQTLPGLSKRWYLVSDDLVESIQLRFRIFFALMLIVIPIVFLSSPSRIGGLIIVALVLPPIAMRFWVLRGAPGITLTEEDLEPVDRRTRDLEQSEAIGEPKLWLLLVAAVAMAALDVFVLISDGTWWAWFGLIMFGTCAVIMARSIAIVRRARRR